MFEIPKLTKDNVVDIYFQIRNNPAEINAFIDKILAIENKAEFDVILNEVIQDARHDLLSRIDEFKNKGKFYEIQIKMLALNLNNEQKVIFNHLLDTNFEEVEEENRYKCFEFLVKKLPNNFIERLKRGQSIVYPNKELLKIYSKNKNYYEILYATTQNYFSKEDYQSLDNKNDELTIIFANMTDKIFRPTDYVVIEKDLKELFNHIDKFGKINLEKYVEILSSKYWDNTLVFNEIKNNFIYFESMGITGYKFFESIMKYCSEDSSYVIYNLNSNFITDEDKEKLKELIFNKINVRIILNKAEELEFNSLNELVRMLVKYKATSRFFENLNEFLKANFSEELDLNQAIKDIAQAEGSLKLLEYLVDKKNLFIEFAPKIPIPENKEELREFLEYLETQTRNGFKLKEIIKHPSLYSELCE